MAAAATAEYFAQIWLGPRRGGREPREREGDPWPVGRLPVSGAAGAGAGAGAGGGGTSAGGRREGAGGRRARAARGWKSSRAAASGRALWAPGVGARGGPGSALSPRLAPPTQLAFLTSPSTRGRRGAAHSPLTGRDARKGKRGAGTLAAPKLGSAAKWVRVASCLRLGFPTCTR